MELYDKAKWHIDSGEKEEIVISRFKNLFLFLNQKNLLSDEGKEILEFGIDSSISIHERMLNNMGKHFMSSYNKIDFSSIEKMIESLEKEYTNLKQE